MPCRAWLCPACVARGGGEVWREGGFDPCDAHWWRVLTEGWGAKRHNSGFAEGRDWGSLWAGGSCMKREANGRVTSRYVSMALIIVELSPLMLDASTAGYGRIVCVYGEAL